MSKDNLLEIEEKCNRVTKGPWKSFFEGLDHESGNSYIKTGGEDIYLSNSLLDNNQDFIASATQDIPRLISEIRRLRTEIENYQALANKI